MTYKTHEIRVYDDGSKIWYQNGKPHREDGPAVEYPDGSKIWYQNGKFHREDGPAVEYSDGSKFWYLEDKLYSEADFLKKINPPKELTVAEIEKLLGYPIKVIEG